MNSKDEIERLKAEALTAIEAAASEAAWNEARVLYTGKKSRLQDLLKELGKLPPAERPAFGQRVNQARQAVEKALEEAKGRLQGDRWASLKAEDAIDITEPGLPTPRGGLHPLTKLMEEVEDIFLSMGFDVFDGPEVETEKNNFEDLNIPADHPARDMQDTFWLTNGWLMRTHTSPVQIRSLRKLKPPIRGIAPGRVFRFEELDASHEHTFHQVEGIMVDREVSVADLKGVVGAFLERVFGKVVSVRLRPGYFPFVEPGYEVDFSCLLCDAKGCSACKRTGWLEFMGAGLVHPNVLTACSVDPRQWQGFAFGFGLERLCMMLHGITDIRHFQSGDLRFLEQF